MVLARANQLIALTAAMALASSAATRTLVATSTGEFQVNGAMVRGSATVLPGQSVATVAAPSRLTLDGGQLTLEPKSRVDYASKGVTLREGGLEARSAGVEALGFRVSPAKGAAAQVRMDGADTVLVAAAGGPVSIFNGEGLLVASLDPGMARWLMPAQGETSVLTGCLRLADGKYFLNDPTTNTTYELRGSGLEANVNKTVEVTGSPFRTATPAPGASQVIRVAAVKAVASGCRGPAPAASKPTAAAKQAKAPKAPKPSSPAPSAPSKPAPPVKSAGSSMSNGAKVGIVAAIAGGGAIAAVALKGDDSSR